VAAISASTIITHAFQTIGVYAPGVTLKPQDAQNGLRRLNNIMQVLSLQPLSKPVQRREEFDLEADKGGPDDPYTIGTGGDFDVTRPTAIRGAGLVLTSSDPTVEIPRAMLTDDAWASIQIKDLGAAQFTDVYFNPTFADDGFATINLWPVPNTDANRLALYWLESLTEFATLTTQYFLPPGCAYVLEYQLAEELLTPYGVTDAGIVGLVTRMAAKTLRVFKRANLELVDLGTDPALTQTPSGGYNILTGVGGGSSI
jgi:hypothetical protein